MFNFNKFSVNIYENALNQLKEKIEGTDDIIFKKRDKTKYFVKEIKTRKIKTEFGILIYKRRIYKYLYKGKWKYVSLVDKQFGVKKWQRIINDLKLKITAEIVKNKRYSDILDMFNCKLHCSSVSRILRKALIKRKDKKIDLKNCKNLYINLDDAHVTLKNKNNKSYLQTVRIISFNTGKENNKFLNKKYCYFFLNKKTWGAEFNAFFIKKQIQKFFKNYENIKLIIGGDSAKWIKKTAKILDGMFIFDRFHTIRELKNNIYCGNRSKESFKNYLHAKELFLQGKYDEFITFLKSLQNERIKLRYFINLKNGILNQNKDWNIGVSAESDVSRIAKSCLGYGNKTFSFSTFKNILDLKIMRFNFS
ncbi:Mbov_0401 family ICE element transposase-like protein [Spiroplasma endosymbiont of Glossina fuscipes fuscipes]|uniref:Mbov_0401 family ICE element transposase-like protein n=1 Tax=Spiroplasma endosymbiont of Glossina fuscipes fuscipes TaxID=2004463 RepID=UPI003C7375D6